MRTRSMVVIVGFSLLASVAFFATRSPSAKASTSVESTSEWMAQQEYEAILQKYQDWTFPQLSEHLQLEPVSDAKLSFEPTSIEYFDVIKERLKMTEEEQAKFSDHGLVVIDPKVAHGFGSVYAQIYTSDLPVLVTTDSVLHAWHRTYDNILVELESQILLPALRRILGECHGQLKTLPQDSARSQTYRDVDVYLSVALNLLEGMGGERWNHDYLNHRPAFDTSEEVVARLKDIKTLRLQSQWEGHDYTNIYGGIRYVDYSQFRPRGHYTKSSLLQNYFRCMMWLGRADCGFHVLAPDPGAGLEIDCRRELQAAALLCRLIRDADQLPRFKSFRSLIQLLVGASDNLTVANLLTLLRDAGLEDDPLKLVDAQDALASAIQTSGLASQKIRSQAITSGVGPHKVPPPALFQMFGQAFALDSFVLSHSVYDSIVFEESKQDRMMPSSLDVAAALGNDYAIALLEPELRKWKYSANLLANREYVQQQSPSFWNDNLYHHWLATLRILNHTPGPHFPEVMTTKGWKVKQLQTQLGSWTELRHDNVLYTKQSYTSVPGCQYPDAYVEPYPDCYERLAMMARKLSRRLDDIRVMTSDVESPFVDKQRKHLLRFADIMSQLASIARQELRAEPMTAEQRQFLACTVDRRGTQPHGSGTKPKYDGWYFELLYGVEDPLSRDPLVADVHTNPAQKEVLQVGVGNVNFAVVAIDNESDKAAYVGPTYSFYEFIQPAEQRMTDAEWVRLVSKESPGSMEESMVFLEPNRKNTLPESTPLPGRPIWTRPFVATPRSRDYGGLSVSSGRVLSLTKINGVETEKLFVGGNDDAGLNGLLESFRRHDFHGRFGVFLGAMSEKSLERLADEPQLAWINTKGCQLSPASVSNFSARRPDVEVLPGPFQLEAAVICDRIDGWKRFCPDKSGRLRPGEELLVYVEANNLTSRQSRFGNQVKMEVTAKLVAPDGTIVMEHQPPPLESSDMSDDFQGFLEVRCTTPEDLQKGSYALKIQVSDAHAAPAKTDYKEIALAVE